MSVYIKDKKHKHVKQKTMQTNKLKHIKNDIFYVHTKVHAWNVDNSSTHSSSGSWIGKWKKETSLIPRLCSFDKCENNATLGGHIWVHRHGPFIAPICGSCNSIRNEKRKEGGGSYLERDVILLKIKTTKDMRTKKRRIARLCCGCGTNISRQPPSHMVCRGCFLKAKYPSKYIDE